MMYSSLTPSLPPPSLPPQPLRLAYLQDKLLVEGFAREVMRSDPSVDISEHQ